MECILETEQNILHQKTIGNVRTKGLPKAGTLVLQAKGVWQWLNHPIIHNGCQSSRVHQVQLWQIKEQVDFRLPEICETHREFEHLWVAYRVETREFVETTAHCQYFPLGCFNIPNILSGKSIVVSLLRYYPDYLRFCYTDVDEKVDLV